MARTLLRKKILGAWLGKAVGGTLGAPWEGSCGPHDLKFYTPVPTGMLPNDDLDLQVVWACRLKRDWNYVVNRSNFASAWLENIDFPYDEYAFCRRNLKRGINPPWCGSFDNWFTNGLGAAIRSELWSCIAPGDPEKAAAFAYEDACLDHAGDGIYAEQFLAAMESKAFVCCDLKEIIRSGLAVIPVDSRLFRAVTDTVAWCSCGDFHTIRSLILEKYGTYNFTDVVMNIPFMVAALLLGKKDFERSILLAVNFGFDADCTGATVGALLGIIDPECIPEKWLRPIGRNMVLSKEITGIVPPASIDDFTDLVLELHDKVVLGDHPEKQPDFSKYAVTFRTGMSAPWFALDFNKCPVNMPENTGTLTVQGNYCTIDLSKVPNDALYLLETDFEIKEAQPGKVLVCTPANVRVWLDGMFLFGRESGPMLPAFHRAPINQIATVELSAGKHTLRIGMAPATLQMTSAELLWGICDLKHFWLI